MSNFHEAADAIQRVSKLLEGFKLAAEALDSAGSFEQAAAEAKKARDAAVKERTKVETGLADARHELEVMRKEGEAWLVSEKARMLQMLNDADQQAKASADRVLKQAKEAADATVANSLTKAAKAEAKYKEITVSIGKAEETLASLMDEVATKRKQIELFDAAILKMKAKFA